MSNNPKDYEFTGSRITAPPIDVSTLLEEGEIDVTHVELSDISETLTYDELVPICKKGKAFIYPFGPVGIMRKGFTKKSRIAFEAGSQRFETIDDAVKFLKEHKGVLVYQCIKYKLPREQYIIRSFSNREYDYIKLNWLTYIWNNLTEWKLKKWKTVTKNGTVPWKTAIKDI